MGALRGAALLTAVTAAAGLGFAANAAPRPIAVVTCAGVDLRPGRLDGSHRIVLGRVGFERRAVLQTAEVDGLLPYWSKTLLFVRAGRVPVILSVPRSWRDHA